MVHNLATPPLVVRNPATLVLRWHMCRPLARFNLSVVWWRGSSKTTPTGFWWLPVFPKKPTVPYGSVSCQNLCAGLTLPPLSTGLWPMVFFLWLTTGFIVVNYWSFDG